MLKATSIALAMLLFTASSNGFQGYRWAGRGDVAAGIAVDGQNMPLKRPPSPDNDPTNPEKFLLNVTPCDDEPTIIEFHKPYRVLRTEQGGCSHSRYGYETYLRVEVEELE